MERLILRKRLAYHEMAVESSLTHRPRLLGLGARLGAGPSGRS